MCVPAIIFVIVWELGRWVFFTYEAHWNFARVLLYKNDYA